MECNKDEASRAKDIAVRKYSEKDLAGAKKFALKAQNLYPALEGISQMLASLEVYISAENKINGEMDMYGVLGVTPLADVNTVKKEYRKLILLIHPDKNKFIGAEGAFQLVSEAFTLLSDEAKKSAYDSRRNVKTAHQKVQSGASAGSTSSGQFQQKFPGHVGVSAQGAGRTVNQKVPNQGGGLGASRTNEQVSKNQSNNSSQQKVPTHSRSSEVLSGVNGHYKHSNATTSRGKASKSSSQKASAFQSFFKKGDTFWTMCNQCKMQYEYMRIYLNQILKCPHCQLGFTATEVHPPSNLSPIRPQREKLSSSSGPRTSGMNYKSGAASAHWSTLFGTPHGTTVHNSYFGSTSAQNTTSANAQVDSEHHLSTEKVKRECEEDRSCGKRERSGDPSFVINEEGPLKKMKEMDDRVKKFGGGILSQSGKGNRDTSMGILPELSKGYAELRRTNHFAGFTSKVNNVNRELLLMETRQMLSERALLEIREKLKDLKKDKEAKTAAKEKTNAKRVERQKSKVVMQEPGFDGNHTDSPVGDAKQKVTKIVSMTVPDPDFHVFDLDRSENCFGDNQVWAAYDDDDGMPRFYAMIHEVISLNPFTVRLSWMNSRSVSEFGSLDWVGHGFIKSCGDFWIGRRETNKSLNSFSHKVRWAKGPRGVIQIYPGKGEIWALYRNWSSDWNNDTPADVLHVYEMVEVLDDYNEEQGVRVAPLLKAAGFRTVFYKQPDPNEVRRIPKEEMFRFSHQVPSHVLTGEEGTNAPKGYIELDSAATPMELLQTTAPDIKDNAMETGSTAE